MTDNRPHTEILTVPPSGSQMLQQLFLQHAAGLHIKAAIDGLVRHAPRLGLWRCPLQPACDLLGRPVELQLSNNSLPQRAMHRQLARLRAQRLLPRELVSRCSPVATYPTIAIDLSADRRCGAGQHPRYCPDRLALHNASRYLLAFRHRQRQTGSASGRRHDPAAGPQMRKNAGGRLAKGATDRLQAFTLLPALPKLRALRCRKSNPMIHRHRSTSSV